MATVTGYTAQKLDQKLNDFHNEMVVSGLVDSAGDLKLTKGDNSVVAAGHVVGPQGPAGPSGGTEVINYTDVNTQRPAGARLVKWVFTGDTQLTQRYPINAAPGDIVDLNYPVSLDGSITFPSFQSAYDLNTQLLSLNKPAITKMNIESSINPGFYINYELSGQNFYPTNIATDTSHYTMQNGVRSVGTYDLTIHGVTGVLTMAWVSDVVYNDGQVSLIQLDMSWFEIFNLKFRSQTFIVGASDGGEGLIEMILGTDGLLTVRDVVSKSTGNNTIAAGSTCYFSAPLSLYPITV